jgi:hypothetical protein
MYQYSVIYRVWCYESKKSYVAYTCNKNRNVRAGSTSLKQNKNLSNEAYKIVHSDYVRFNLIKYFPCQTLNELLLEVDKIIKTIDCVNKPLSDFDREIMTKYKCKSRREYNSAYYKAYYEKHKHKYKYDKDRDKKLKRKNNFHITCECGVIIKKYYLPSHLKTKRHNKRMNSP